MNDLVNEIENMTDLLTKSGFFSAGEIKEIIEEQFIYEDIDLKQFNINTNKQENRNFQTLEKIFGKLVQLPIQCTILP